MEDEKYVVVVGGMNMDLAGISGETYKERDSNIGTIKICEGGVGQNIAQNLVKLDVPTYLITVYGDDYFGKFLSEEVKRKSISLDYAEEIPGECSSTYLYVTNNEGDMVVAINDMAIMNHITPAFLKERIDFINHAAACVIDGNIPKESIEWLANHCTAPIFIDPVSVAKANRFENVLDKIDTFKPNGLEAEYLTGIKVTDEHSAEEAARVLVNKGIKNVFISLGAKGILCVNKSESVFIPTYKSNIISCNGAGDCTMATIVWARHLFENRLSLKEIGHLTQASASITVESSQSVSPHMSVENVLKRTKQYVEK